MHSNVNLSLLWRGILSLSLLLTPAALPAAQQDVAAEESASAVSPSRFDDPALQLIGIPDPESGDEPEAASNQSARLLQQARQAYSQRDQREKIIECVELIKAALALQPDNLERNLQFAAAVTWFQGYHSRGQYDQELLKAALASARTVLESEPDNPLARYLHGMLNAFMGRALSSLRSFSYFGFMEQELEWVITYHPDLDYGGAYRAMGRYLAQMPGLLGGNPERAVDYYRQAVRIAPIYLLNYLLLAELYLKTGQESQARPLLRQVLDSSPPIPALEPEWRLWRVRAERVWQALNQNQVRDEEY
jgi:tetratricopeptide (TPR) repeat protein